MRKQTTWPVQGGHGHAATPPLSFIYKIHPQDSYRAQSSLVHYFSHKPYPVGESSANPAGHTDALLPSVFLVPAFLAHFSIPTVTHLLSGSTRTQHPCIPEGHRGGRARVSAQSDFRGSPCAAPVHARLSRNDLVPRTDLLEKLLCRQPSVFKNLSLRGVLLFSMPHTQCFSFAET